MRQIFQRQGRADRQPYQVLVTKSIDDFVKNVDFIREGFDELQHLLRVTWEEFTSSILRGFRLAEDQALFAIFLSKNGKPLGFIFVVDESISSTEKQALIYAAYSNGRYVGAADEAVSFAEEWAKKNGFTTLLASSRRMNGAAMRLFKEKLGFKAQYVMFGKEL